MNILILTAYDDDEYVFALVEAGAAGYLLKDVPSDELVNAIRDIQNGDPVLHASVMKKLMQRMADPGTVRPSTVRLGEALTGRELEVISLAGHGLTNVAIGNHLHLSPRTVQTHLRNIFNKLCVSSRTEAVVKALQLGLVKGGSA